MKATVMECKDGKAVVLTEEGQFCNVQGSYETGQIIDYKAPGKTWQPVSAKRRIVRRAAAAVCAVMILGSGAYMTIEPAAAMTVSLGDEYAVEYLLDEEGNVLRVEATSEAGKDLAKQLTAGGVKGKDINDAIDMTEQITGVSYDAVKEPPAVEGKDEKAGAELAREITQKHSGAEKEPADTEPAGVEPKDRSGSSAGKSSDDNRAGKTGTGTDTGTRSNVKKSGGEAVNGKAISGTGVMPSGAEANGQANTGGVNADRAGNMASGNDAGRK